MTPEARADAYSRFRTGAASVLLFCDFMHETNAAPTAHFMLNEFSECLLPMRQPANFHFIHFELPTAYVVKVAKARRVFSPEFLAKAISGAHYRRVRMSDELDADAQTTIFFDPEVDWYFAGSLYVMVRQVNGAAPPKWLAEQAHVYLDWLDSVRA